MPDFPSRSGDSTQTPSQHERRVAEAKMYVYLLCKTLTEHYSNRERLYGYARRLLHRLKFSPGPKFRSALPLVITCCRYKILQRLDLWKLYLDVPLEHLLNKCSDIPDASPHSVTAFPDDLHPFFDHCRISKDAAEGYTSSPALWAHAMGTAIQELRTELSREDFKTDEFNSHAVSVYFALDVLVCTCLDVIIERTNLLQLATKSTEMHLGASEEGSQSETSEDAFQVFFTHSHFRHSVEDLSDNPKTLDGSKKAIQTHLKLAIAWVTALGSICRINWQSNGNYFKLISLSAISLPSPDTKCADVQSLLDSILQNSFIYQNHVAESATDIWFNPQAPQTNGEIEKTGEGLEAVEELKKRKQFLLGRAQEFHGSVHCESSIMVLQDLTHKKSSALNHTLFYALDVSDVLASTIPLMLQSQGAVRGVGVARKPCCCCYLVGKHLGIALPGTNGRIWPWSPPPLTPVNVLRVIATNLENEVPRRLIEYMNRGLTLWKGSRTSSAASEVSSADLLRLFGK